MLHEDIKKEMQKALKEKNQVKLEVMRGILTAFTNELVSKKNMPSGILSDEDALLVIKKQAKQRKDSIEQFDKGGRSELADKEKKELEILEDYLPEEVSKEEIKKVAIRVKEELGITDKSKMGQLMGSVMKELKGNADGTIVKDIVSSLFD